MTCIYPHYTFNGSNIKFTTILTYKYNTKKMAKINLFPLTPLYKLRSII